MSTQNEKERLELLQGTLDLLILRTLIFGSRHGQGIARAIQDTSPANGEWLEASIRGKSMQAGVRARRGVACMRKMLSIGIFFVANFAVSAQTEMPKPAYDFSLPREEKIKLAESAAPPEISSHATVYVLEPTGYLKIREGTNGFSCFVDRQNLLNLEPACFDAEGSATTLLTRFYAEEQRAKGKGEEQINAEIAEGYKSGKFKVPSKPGIVYMMSEKGFLFVSGANKLVPIPPHLMFYAPYATDKEIGSPPSARNMPRVIRPGQPDAYIIVIPGPVDHPGH